MKSDSALALARQGFKVFPIRDGAKAPPLVVGWQMCATTDENQVRDWWAKWPDANIGIHCDGLVVLDVDAGKGGYDSLKTLEAERGKLPATFTVSTPSGGAHLYFKGENTPNGVNVYGKGIDVRSGGGYVLAPGSIVGGKPYTTRTTMAPAAAPEWLQDRPQAIKAEKSIACKVLDTDQDIAAQQMVAWLLTQPPVVEGERNHRGYAVAAQARDFGLTEDNTVALLEKYWDCQPPLDDAELRHVVHSAFTYAQNAPATLSAEALFDALPVEPKPQGASILWHASEAHVPAKWVDDYLVQGLLQHRSDAQIFGATNAGKTFVALDMGVHIAAGKEWLGQRISQAPVLYVAYEGKENIRTRRMAALRRKLPELAWDALPFAILDMNEPLVNEGNTDQNALPGRQRLQSALAEFAERYGAAPKVLFVDTYSRAIGGDASSEVLAQRFASMTGALIRTYGLTVIRIHHPGHANQERARGAYAATAGLDTNLRVEDGTIIGDKQRDSASTTLGFKLDVVTLGKNQHNEPVTTCVTLPRELGGTEDLPPNEAELYEAIKSCTDAEGFVERAAAVALSGLSKGAADTAWRRLKVRGALITTGRRVKVANHGTAASIFD